MNKEAFDKENIFGKGAPKRHLPSILLASHF
jgi:hypothetical protein